MTKTKTTKTTTTKAEPALTRLPHACSACESGSHDLLHLHARCHVHAPMRLAYLKREDQRIIAVSCWLPECSLPVAAFGVESAQDLPPSSREQNPPPCDLCGDNDPRWFQDVSSRAVREFTAPFRLEMHGAGDDRTLHVRCYVEECDRLLAVLALTPNAPGGASV